MKGLRGWNGSQTGYVGDTVARTQETNTGRGVITNSGTRA